MTDVLAAVAVGLGVAAVVLPAGIFMAERRLPQTWSAEMIAIVIGVALLAGFGTMWVLL